MISALAFLLALAAAGPSEAQQGAKSSVKERQAIHAFGQCVAVERTAETRKLLAMDFRQKDYGTAMRRLLDKPASCRHVQVPRGAYASGGLLWGGALAEGLLRRDEMLERLGAATAHLPELPDIEARNAGELMAFCTVRANPAAVAALLIAEPATSEEYEAIGALGDTLGSCVPANSKSNFTREALRALLALGAHRLVVHNQQARPNA
ncbi:MAG: hypothetical protein LOX97_00345 [Sphingomonas sp.]|nr:hypothetical protein [Sphingomonas sp.]